MKITPDNLADLVVTAIKGAVDGPKVGGRLAALEARIRELAIRKATSTSEWPPSCGWVVAAAAHPSGRRGVSIRRRHR